MPYKSISAAIRVVILRVGLKLKLACQRYYLSKRKKQVHQWLRILAKDLKFRYLSEIIGQEIIIYSLESAKDDVKNGLNDVFRKQDFELIIPSDIKHLRGMIGKYRMIDMRFKSATPLGQTDMESGFSLLRRLKIGTKFEVDDIDTSDPLEVELLDMAMDYELMTLEGMVKQIKEDAAFIVLLLETDYDYPSNTQERVKMQVKHMQQLPDDYFPRKFVIKDAALTNAGAIWSKLHFYF